MDLSEVNAEALQRELDRRNAIAQKKRQEEQFKRYVENVTKVTDELRVKLQAVLSVPLSDDNLADIIEAVDTYHEDYPY
jgi:hypothetical protein